MVRRIGVLVTLLIVLMSSCALASKTVAVGAGPPHQSQIVVTRPGTPLPGCSISAVARSVATAFDDLNSGRFEKLDRFFAPALPRRGHGFVWFSLNVEGMSKVVRERRTLMPYLKALFRSGERYRLKMLVARRDVTGSLGLGLALEETSTTSPGSSPGREVIGKAQLDCPSKTAYVLSMGSTDDPSQTPTPYRPCPMPVQPVDETAVIACLSH